MSQQTTRPKTRPDRGAAVRARLAGLAATVVLLAAVVGLPVLLLALGANPIPARLPSLGLLW